MRETQQEMYALNLQPEKFKTSVDDAVNLERIQVSDCERFASFQKVCSTYDYENQRMVDSPFAKGPKAITFAHVLRYGTFPLAPIVQRLLDICTTEMQGSVELEFAADLSTGIFSGCGLAKHRLFRCAHHLGERPGHRLAGRPAGRGVPEGIGL